MLLFGEEYSFDISIYSLIVTLTGINVKYINSAIAEIKIAKSIKMPNANIDKAIKKGAGELENIVYEEASYEGYGPNGVAVFIEVITDNKNRTVAEIRHVLSKFGGSLGQNGSGAWNFD